MQYGNSNSGRLPELRARLRELQGNMSVTDFADKLGLSRQTVGFYLNGNRIPDSETLIQICNACHVSADWLLGIENEPLGLSPKAIYNIKSAQKDENGSLFIDGINMLLEDYRFLLIAKDVKQFSDIVKSEKEYVLNYLDKNYSQNQTWHDRDTYMFLSDEQLADDLLQELKANHPGIAARISVSCGRSALDGNLRAIVEDFRSDIEWITGYMKYMADVVWSQSDRR